MTKEQQLIDITQKAFRSVSKSIIYDRYHSDIKTRAIKLIKDQCKIDGISKKGAEGLISDFNEALSFTSRNKSLIKHNRDFLSKRESYLEYNVLYAFDNTIELEEFEKSRFRLMVSRERANKTTLPPIQCCSHL